MRITGMWALWMVGMVMAATLAGLVGAPRLPSRDPNSATAAPAIAIPSYNVTFTETGLPAKLLSHFGWTVVLGGTRLHGNSTSLVFSNVTNGSYWVLVTGPSGYVAAYSNQIPVAGMTGSNVEFGKARTVTLSFGEKGLPKGQQWCVALNGFAQCTTTGTVKFLNLTPWDYAYSVLSPLSGQSIVAKVGKLVIGDANGTVTFVKSETVLLTFSYYYAVTFTEVGAPGVWYITIKGTIIGVPQNHTIEFNLTNGTYSYKIGAESGYKAVGVPPKVTVNGAPASVEVTFSGKHGP